MADLTVSIQESITLPNRNKINTFNNKVITGVNQITRRIDTIATTFEDTGIEILRFVDSEEQQVAGSFVRDTVKYIRITNLDDTHYCTIYLIKTNLDNVLFKLDAGKSMMFANAFFDSNNSQDYVQAGYLDEQYYSSFTTMDVIKAKADESSLQLEMFVGSS